MAGRSRTPGGAGRADEREPPDRAAEAVGDVQVAARVERERVRERHALGAREALAPRAVACDPPDSVHGGVGRHHGGEDVSSRIDGEAEHAVVARVTVELELGELGDRRDRPVARDREDLRDEVLPVVSPVAEVDGPPLPTAIPSG